MRSPPLALFATTSSGPEISLIFDNEMLVFHAFGLFIFDWRVEGVEGCGLWTDE
jgi:hypothetical protein